MFHHPLMESIRVVRDLIKKPLSQEILSYSLVAQHSSSYQKN